MHSAQHERPPFDQPVCVVTDTNSYH
jgi:hypothetical protein